MARVLAEFLLCNLLAITAPATAQTARDARLIITVTDPSGGVVPNAIVTVVGLDEAVNAATPKPLPTSQTGLVTFEGLAPGRYSVRAEFAGFGTGLLKELRLRAGDNKHIIVLPLKNMQDSVTVVQDAQAAAADPRGTSFRTMLTREDIEALSDDPAEMAQQLQDIAGGNAVFRIDSFIGGALPPKPMIKSIHVVRDTFSAENHSAESDEIQIITQPGVGPLHGTGTTRLRDGSMSGQSPFTSVKGPEHTQNYQGNLGGTLVERKASFSLSGSVTRSFDTPIVNVALPNGGAYSDILPLRRPADAWTTYDLLDYAITRDQALRVGYSQNNNFRDNLGVGAYDIGERAYSSRVHDHELRIQEAGPLGRRMFAATRLELNWTDTVAHAALEAPTIRVLDGFTRGGAQIRGGRRSHDFEFGSDLDYIRGIHSVRLGTLIEGGHYRSDDATNYLGTYTFNSVADYELGQPALFVRRIGSPIVDYWNVNSGVYIQDDIRFKKTLTLSPGLRYEVQTHVRNAGNVNPRFGVTWAPFKSGRTTLRSSYGAFNNWVSTGVYEQTLRVDGFHQLDVSVVDPPYPATDPGGVSAAPNRYLLGDVQLVRTQRVSAGIDQALTPRVRLGLIYSHVSGAHVLRGENLNAPIDGRRPDIAFANEIRVVSDGELRTNQLQTNLTVNLAPPGRAGGAVNWRRTNFRVSYTMRKDDNDSDGAFTVPPSGTLSTEWGPAPNDRRRRWAGSINSQFVRNLTATLSLEGGTGTPYSITTGYDDNGDLIFNDRPSGLGRNTERTATLNTWRANFTYALAVGPPSASGRRYRLAWTVNALNPMNHSNYTGYSGVMTSLFFRQPTAVLNPRKVDLSMSFNF